MTGDNLRWAGTTGIAGLIALLALAGIIILSAGGRSIPDVLTAIASLGAGGFFTAFGSMVGARSSQNGAQIALGQSITGGGIH